MTRNQINRKIAREIIRAQYASDAGKGFENSGHIARMPMYFKYAAKPTAIRNAIELIRRNKTDFNYYCMEDEDQNGYPSVIVFFEWKLDDTRHQVSFHSPWSTAEILYQYISTGRKTRWNKIRGGSLRSTAALREYFGI